jgi:hypothetical protein
MLKLSLLVSLTLLGACADPFGYGSNAVTPEGVELSVNLMDIREATVAGQTVHDGDTILVPRDQLRVGVNTWDFLTDKGEVFGEIGLTWGIMDALQPTCAGGEGTITGDAQPSYTQALRVQNCPLVNGAIEFQITPLANGEMTVDGGTVENNTIRIPVMHLAMDQALSANSSFGAGRIRTEATLRIHYPEGADWEQSLAVGHRESPVAPFLDNLPASLQTLDGQVSDTPTVAVFKSGAYYWVAGTPGDRTLKDVDLFIALESQGTPFDLGRCAFQSMSGGGGGFSTAVQGIPTTHVAYDRSGTEVARTVLRPSGCPISAVADDDDMMTVTAGDGKIRAWAESLLSL